MVAGALMRGESQTDLPDLASEQPALPSAPSTPSEHADAAPARDPDPPAQGSLNVKERWPSPAPSRWFASPLLPGDLAASQPSARETPPRAATPAAPEPPVRLARPAAADIVVVRPRPQAGNDLVPPPRVVRIAARRDTAEMIAAAQLTWPQVRPESNVTQQRIPQGAPEVADVPTQRVDGEVESHERRLALSGHVAPGEARVALITEPALVAESVEQDERNDAAPPQLAEQPEPGDASAPRSDELASRTEQDPAPVAIVRVSEPEVAPEEVIEEARSDVVGPEVPEVIARLDPAVWREGERMVGPAQTGEVRDEAELRATPASLAPPEDQPVALVSHPRISTDRDAQPLPMPTNLNVTIVSKGERVLRGPRKSPADLLGLNAETRAAAAKCLATAVYFEARGEPISGQIAVAQVVLNRAFSGFYPRDICGVVYQNAEKRLSCQFTFACDGKADAVRDNDAWGRAIRIAGDMLDGRLWIEDVGKSTHYHAHWVAPAWTSGMKTKVEIGVHTFYRPRAWGDGSRAPSWGDDTLTSLVPVSSMPW